MKNSIYTCFNTLTNRYERTFEAESDQMASYAFKASKPTIPTYDYLELCKIADVDCETGLVTPMSAPIRISKFEEKSSEPLINSIEKATIKE